MFYTVLWSISFLCSKSMIFYFSGTGNSEWVAREIAKSTADRIHFITDESTYHLDLATDESLGFVFPIYAWAAPERVLRFLQGLKTNHTPSYLYVICTCGDDTGKAPQMLVRIFEKKGWTCSLFHSITMPNTYVSLPTFNVDAPAVIQKKREQAEKHLADVIELLNQKKTSYAWNEGAVPWLKTKVIHPVFSKFLMSPRYFSANDACISCGMCEKVCPLRNIKLKTARPIWGNNCSMCLSCYHHCPKHAIHYGILTKGKGQYTFKEK